MANTKRSFVGICSGPRYSALRITL